MIQTKKLFLLFASLSVLIVGETQSTEPSRYSSPNSSEARLSFRAYVELNLGYTSFVENEIQRAIDLQIEQIIGPMRRSDFAAGLYPDYKTRILNTRRVGGWASAEYEFAGTLAVRDDAPEYLPLILITNPQNGVFRGIRSCLPPDHFFPFYYYWDPKTPGCALQEGRDYVQVQARLERIPNAKNTYPSYEKLINRNGEISIHALFGPDSKTSVRFNPDKDQDIGVKSYRKFRRELLAAGYEIRKWSGREIDSVFSGLNRHTPIVEEAVKMTPRGKIRIRLVLGQTFVLTESFGFREFFARALEQASVVLYSGHTGQGYDLDIGTIRFLAREELRPPEHYQLFHFSTCLSYTFYARDYLEWKNRDLDFITYAGDETQFKAMPYHLFMTVSAIESWAMHGTAKSFQELLSRMKDDRVLVGVMNRDDR